MGLFCFSRLLLPVWSVPTLRLVHSSERKEGCFWAKDLYKWESAWVRLENMESIVEVGPQSVLQESCTVFKEDVRRSPLMLIGSLDFFTMCICGQVWIRLLFYFLHFSYCLKQSTPFALSYNFCSYYTNNCRLLPWGGGWLARLE